MLAINLEAQPIISELSKSTPEPYLNNSYEYFGQSVSVSGDFAVVGALGYNIDQGRAYVLHMIDENWETVGVLTASDGIEGDYFGYSVAISGDCIVIGAYKDGENNQGAAYVFEKPLSGWTDMTETAKLSVSDDYDDYDCLGYSVNISGDIIVLGASRDDVSNSSGIARGSAYVYEKPLDGWVSMTETAKLTASDGQNYDEFGCSVDISGDCIVVGAQMEEGDGESRGAAYVFKEPFVGWTDMTETAKLTASTPEDYDFFGASVSIDGSTIVVGTPGNSGLVYVFNRQAIGWENWDESALLHSLPESVNANFGSSVCISNNDILVGADFDQTDGYQYGAAYIFTKPATGWEDTIPSAKFSSATGSGFVSLGKSVSVSGDNCFVGCFSNDSIDHRAGAVSTFSKPGSEWVDTTGDQIILPDFPWLQNSLNYYGYSVSVSGDYSVIGACKTNRNEGCAYVLYNNGSEWETLAKLTASDGEFEDLFGKSVKIDGDYIIIGAPENDFSGYYSGSAYLFEKPATGWEDMTETVKFTTSDLSTYGNFGATVSISGDVAVISRSNIYEAPYFYNAAYVYVKPSEGWTNMTETARLTSSDISQNGFCTYFDISDDIIAVGVAGGSENGAVYVYEKPETGWEDMTENAVLTTTNGEPDDYFGSRISVSGNQIVVSAYSSDINGSNTGMAYVFEKPLDGWLDTTQNAILTASDGLTNDYFGISVSNYEDRIIVGAVFADQTTSSGVAYIYARPEDGWVDMTEAAILVPSDGSSGDKFGQSVCNEGNVFIVGSPQDDDNGHESGAAYFFEINYWPITIIEQPQVQSSSCLSVVEYSISGENINDYQWQVSTDGGTTFVDVIDDENYSGTQSNTLSISVDASLNESIYRCFASNPLYSEVSTQVTLSVDSENPIILSEIEEQFISLDDNCEASVPDYTSSVSTSDNCDPNVQILQSPEVGEIISGDENLITITATDYAGNYSQIDFNIVAFDDLEPTLLCLDTQYRICDEFQSTYIVQGEEFDLESVYDNCEIESVTNDYTGTTSLANAELSIGTTDIEWTVYDLEGNSSTCSMDVIISPYTSLNSYNSKEIRIFPNPTLGVITIDFSNQYVEQVSLMDLTGKILFSATEIEKIETIDLSDYRKGLYFLKVQLLDENLIMKVVKQ